MDEHRINNETLEESKISSLIELELKELGYLIVQVKINKSNRNTLFGKIVDSSNKKVA